MWRPDSVKWGRPRCQPKKIWRSRWCHTCEVAGRDGTRWLHHQYVPKPGGLPGHTTQHKFKDQNMMVIGEGRRPHCWSCKQLGHFFRSCPQTTKMPNTTAIVTTAITAILAATAAITTEPGKKTRTWGPPKQRRGVDPGSQKGEETPKTKR